MTSRQLMLDLSRHAIQQATRVSISERFQKFNAENPHILPELIRLAKQAKADGRQHIGIRWLWEEFRHSHWKTTGTDWKCNDQFTSRFVRLIVEREPSLRPMFELRELRAA